MRMTYFKAILKTAVRGATVLLLGAGVAGAQTAGSVSLTAAPTTTTLPDGSVVPMWGYSCGTVASATCTSLNPTYAVTPSANWSPVVITVATGSAGTASLTINLTNNLTS